MLIWYLMSRKGELPGVVGEDVRGVRVVAELPRIGRCHRGKDDFGSFFEEHSGCIFEVGGESLDDFRGVALPTNQRLL